MEKMMKVLVWLTQVQKAVVQGVTGQYVVDYGVRSCTCKDHEKRHRECKHIRLVLDEIWKATPRRN